MVLWDATSTKILSFILFPEDDTDEEFWAGDFNGDEEIDILTFPVVDSGGLLSVWTT